MLRPRVGLWSGIWWLTKTLRGQSVCESYDPAFWPRHGQTKADWKQRLAVYYSCWGMSVENSPLICFILFYEAVTPNSVVCAMLFLRVPPLGAPCLFSRYQSCCGGICALDYNSMYRLYIGIVYTIAAQQGESNRVKVRRPKFHHFMLVENLNMHCFS